MYRDSFREQHARKTQRHSAPPPTLNRDQFSETGMDGQPISYDAILSDIKELSSATSGQTSGLGSSSSIISSSRDEIVVIMPS